jgi:hypothetical protein
VAASGLGEVRVLGDRDGGFGTQIDAGFVVGGDRRLEVDARVGLGQVRVDR